MNDHNTTELLKAMEGLPEAFLVLSHEWRFIYLNQHAVKIIQRERDDLIGNILWESFPEAVGTIFHTEYQRAMYERVPVTFETFHPRIGRWLSVRAYPSDIGIVVLFRDVPRQETEQALQESERRFRLMANAMPVLVWTADAVGQCDWVNQAWLDFTGRRMADEMGSNWDISIHPEDRERCRAAYDTFLPLRQEYQIEYRLRRRDGEYRWLLETGSPRLYDDGTFVGFIGSCIDITDRKQAEAERETALKRAEEAVIQQRAFLRDVFLSVTEGKLRLCEGASDLPKILPRRELVIPLTASTLKALRHGLRIAADSVGLPSNRRDDLVIAAGEAAMNAVVHAGGGGAIVSTDPASGKVQVRIDDRGTGIALDHLPRAALERGFSGSNSFGHGFPMILQTVDHVCLRTGMSGTTIILEQEREDRHLSLVLNR